MATPTIIRARMTPGQYRRYEEKSDQARKNSFRHLHSGAHWKKSKKWERTLFKIGKCEIPTCRVFPANTYWLPCTPEGQPPDALLCYIHAPREGFCSVCSCFVAGMDDEYLALHGLCRECANDLRREEETSIDERGHIE